MSQSYGTLQGRDLDEARDAYQKRDAQLSKAAHQANLYGVKKAIEGHGSGGDFIKSIVYGGVDGILTSFAIISGAAGGNLTPNVVLVLGLSNVFADALSMGVGEAVSTISFNEHVEMERRRECWEFDNFPEGEIEEMVDLYEQRGLPRDKAEIVISTMAKYHDFFIDVMMCEELKLKIPDADENPWKDGAVTFASFLVFGILPILGYVIVPALYPDASPHTLFTTAGFVTLLVLFLLGFFKSRFSTMSWWLSGLEFMGLGFVVAATSYGIGIGVGDLARSYFGIDPSMIPEL